MMVAMRSAKAARSVPFILVALAVLSCVFVVHATAAGGGYRRALLLPYRDAAVADAQVVVVSGIEQQEKPSSTAELEGELPAVADEGSPEEETMRRMEMQTQDYPGSGANSRHDPRNPH
ncbi:hypothetical protein GUJ93_ZPchr0001g31438 [Zizania palustris]|uniref:Uncharacterized protein n=1 Tax=Zizania palustris TaxID=103762 RepID=A0A8J5VS15_ZIZPA|nr:hypothetical protein GUJ93_ZPchr0001g31438 [Zizania palustris]